MIYSQLLLYRLFKHRNVIDAQCLLCRIECCNVRNRCVENLVTVLAATAKLAAEPRYTTALHFKVGLNLMSYVYIHKKRDESFVFVVHPTPIGKPRSNPESG